MNWRMLFATLMMAAGCGTTITMAMLGWFMFGRNGAFTFITLCALNMAGPVWLGYEIGREERAFRLRWAPRDKPKLKIVA